MSFQPQPYPRCRSSDAGISYLGRTITDSRISILLLRNKATFYRANKFEVTKKRFYQFFTENNKDKSTIKMKEEEGMKVSKRVKGKVLCRAERIRFTARQKLSLVEEKSSQLFLSVAMK